MPADEESVNPLYLSWVKEWLDKAREHNSKGVVTYKNAYNSLKACPMAFTHPCQLQALKGFGPKLCDRLTQKLQEHCEANGLPMPQKKRRAPGVDQSNGVGDDNLEDEDAAEARPAKKPRKAKPYVPKLRSGAYALIMGMTKSISPNGMTKSELIEEAQPYCDSSFSAPSDPTSFYTAWSSMKTLLDKDLVHERRGPTKRYTLTDDGREVAARIYQTENPGATALPRNLEPPSAKGRLLRKEQIAIPPQPQSAYADLVPTTGGPSSSSSALPNFRPICLRPGSFTVQLVLDVREIRAKTDRDYMQQELAKKGIPPIVRSLELGDALWVAKCHDAHFLPRTGAEGDEVVLDWIVERKRLDDLIGSIKDGRFHEQKFRLKRSGLKNIIYIVEEMNIDSINKEKYEEAVQSAIASTQVVNGYFVKKTQKMDDTIRYLTRMTLLFKKQYESRPLYVIPTGVLTTQNYLPLLEHLCEKVPGMDHHISYPAFASLVSKSDTMTLRDVYLKMLMCTRGVTGEKAIEIQKRWKTPRDFVEAFEKCGDTGDVSKKRKQQLVAGEIGKLYGRKKIAGALSQKIADVWGDP
ncbi:Crossover junction endonuclease mus81 [Apiospora phragmitis]|uniref:Crossover junction endonuclease MUS81 n=1 Tax=Apiospora phragmitis TaxID=2905665 RepID=A0ABR1TQU9_9PEZI